ncbi:MAG TPA: DNA-binding domain-containing protein [Methylibium sp.]|nr:DNA-binding domain-containing protein [Methylibium sp.]
MSAGLLDAQALLQRHVLGQSDAGALVAGDAAHAEQRLGIYVDAYRLRLAETLADAYEKTRLWLGEERFERLARRYIAAFPPTVRNLRGYGAHFAGAVAGWLPDAPAAAELARLDGALRDAFDGPDAAALPAAALAAVAPEAWATLGLELHPTARLLAFEHNSVAVWQALDDDTPPPPMQRGDRPVTWLVWRKGLQPHFRSLSPVEAALLAALLAGERFAAACAEAAGDDAEAAAQIGACLRRWIDDELLVGLIDAG